MARGQAENPLPDVSVHALHVCRNLVFEFIYSCLSVVMLDVNLVYLFIIWGLCGSASVRDLMYLALYGPLSVQDLDYWNFILKVEYSYMEIYFTSLILFNRALWDSVPNDPVLF